MRTFCKTKFPESLWVKIQPHDMKKGARDDLSEIALLTDILPPLLLNFLLDVVSLTCDLAD
jgi:hypothetical protein